MCVDTCIHIDDESSEHPETCFDTRSEMCVDICAHMCLDLCIGNGIFIDPEQLMRVDMCLDMCADMGEYSISVWIVQWLECST